ncbi:PAS domain-containing protein [Rhodovibrionaceae bacterium A322]
MITVASDLLLSDPLHQEAYYYWTSLCRPDDIPGRTDLDPIAIPNLLPWTNLVDVVWDGDQRFFRHRLIGTQLVQFFKREATGGWFHENYTAAHLEKQLPAYHAACLERQANVRRIVVPLEDGGALDYQRLIMPLSEPGQPVDTLFLIFACKPIIHMDEDDNLPLYMHED